MVHYLIPLFIESAWLVSFWQAHIKKNYGILWGNDKILKVNWLALDRWLDKKQAKTFSLLLQPYVKVGIRVNKADDDDNDDDFHTRKC